MDIPPIRKPDFSNVLAKTSLKMLWYLKEAVPLFLIGTFILYLADIIGLINFLQRFLGPFFKNLLNMPEQIFIVFLIGFLRRDYGAAGLLILFQNNTLNSFQTFVCCVMITLFVPCFAQFLVTIKEFGSKIAIAISTFNSIYAIAIGVILVKLGKIFKITL
jgi:ferrous iron transport protein B